MISSTLLVRLSRLVASDPARASWTGASKEWMNTCCRRMSGPYSPRIERWWFRSAEGFQSPRSLVDKTSSVCSHLEWEMVSSRNLFKATYFYPAGDADTMQTVGGGLGIKS